MSKQDNGNVSVKDPIKAPEKLKPPRKWAVILLNDDYTTFEFVIIVLQRVFNKPYEEAKRIAKEVHTNDAGVAGIYTYEIAETKAAVVTQLATAAEFPLRADLRSV